MSPNGRRAWRVAAKKLRRKIGRRVRDLDHRSTPISGAWFRRHGFTMDDPRYQIRQYIGTWGTVDGDGVEFAIKPASFTPRSLVGMTQGARKRRVRSEYADLCRVPDPALMRAATLATWNESELEAGVQRWAAKRSDLRAKYLIGQKLRPCPGCCACWGSDISPAGYGGDVTECFGPLMAGKSKRAIANMKQYQRTLADDCDGSGVLPARRSK